MTRRISTVTQNGMIPSQPGVSCAVSSYNDDAGEHHVLYVTRHYDHVPNEYGGIGVFQRLDAYGLEFPSSDEAFAYALDRGYLQRFFYPELRAIRKKRALTKSLG